MIAFHQDHSAQPLHSTVLINAPKLEKVISLVTLLMITTLTNTLDVFGDKLLDVLLVQKDYNLTSNGMLVCIMAI